VVKRLFDLVVTALALLASIPILVVAAFGIRLSSPGPVLHRATRAGKRGRLFVMYKLRTMDSRAGVLTSSVITANRDPRVFPFGALLRRSKVDELPQLFNILRGDMTVVGPRPEDPKVVAQHYTPEQWETLDVVPGLTSPGALYSTTHGESVLSQRNAERDYYEHLLPMKLALDRVYIRRASLGYDLRVIARTAAVIAGRALGRRHFADPPEMDAARRLIDSTLHPLFPVTTQGPRPA
jgi:lipopolysaccharide/colanic/teichoic acid biosynthesis glycosyltransferase